MYLFLFDVAARFHHLEPPQVLDGFVRALNGAIHRVLYGGAGGAGEFDDFIDWIFYFVHELSITSKPGGGHGVKPE